jgi:hypothetical protein
MTRPRWLLHAGVALALAAPLALWPTRGHVVPSLDGYWRGLSDPPSLLRVVVSLAVGIVLAMALSRLGPGAPRPFLWMLLAVSPLLAVWWGRVPLLLLFQGPVLVVLAGAVLGLTTLRAVPRQWPERLTGPVAFAAGFAFYVLVGTGIPGPAGPQGDEPHYLAMAHSLLTDGDLDLADEFANREYAAFFAGELRAHTSPASPPGTVYPVHTPGLPALLLPAYALGGATGARVFMAALAALAGALTHRVVRHAFDSAPLAAGAWAILTFAPPLPFYAVSLYPETPAALATAAFLLPGRGKASLVAAGVAAAALPWLHPKFLPLALAGLALAAARRDIPGATRAALLGGPIVSLALLLGFFAAVYGRPALGAAYGPGLASDVSPFRIPWGALALLTDRQYGLLACSPAWFLALPGFVALYRERRRDALRTALLAGASAAVGAAFSMWWGGSCPPARFLVPALPALAVATAPALRVRPGAAAALAGAGLAVVALAIGAPRAIHNRTDGESALLRFLAPALDLDASLPSFVPEGTAASVVLALSLLAVAGLAWAWGLRGLVAGLAAYTILAAPLRGRPLIDPRGAPQQLLAAWEPARLRAPGGPPKPNRLFVPLDLPGAPWTLAPADWRASRRDDLPPGFYRIDVAARAVGAPAGTNVARVELTARDLLLEQTYLRAGEPDPSLLLVLPVGARGLRLSVTGAQAGAVVSGARAVPLAIVPVHLRGPLSWPRVPDADRYRVVRGAARVTVLDRSVPEGDGFRLDGAQGSFVLEAPPGRPVEVRVLRPQPDPGDAVTWAGQRILLGPAPDRTIGLPVDSPVTLAGVALVAVRVDATGAWVGFSAP